MCSQSCVGGHEVVEEQRRVMAPARASLPVLTMSAMSLSMPPW
jgi:hypothetical protein